ncbi:hypothetical protein AVEN_68483-1 [Araneus ventricosus]|uniref:Uncharacterized protein n=1 Tax=Araneus ventricosus TaxID=182803 RepID=A0A4Y1ZVP9_ARAVE|nr:hypothetical protein AVEN_68483-1 [Araneus ventricosus]
MNTVFLRRHRYQSASLQNHASSSTASASLKVRGRGCTAGDRTAQTELLNKVLSDTNRMGTCVVMKQHNALTEHSLPFVLNCTPQFSQCFTVSYRIDGFTSGKELNKQNAVSVSEHSAHDFV